MKLFHRKTSCRSPDVLTCFSPMLAKLVWQEREFPTLCLDWHPRLPFDWSIWLDYSRLYQVTEPSREHWMTGVRDECNVRWIILQNTIGIITSACDPNSYKLTILLTSLYTRTLHNIFSDEKTKQKLFKAILRYENSPKKLSWHNLNRGWLTAAILLITIMYILLRCWAFNSK